MSDLKTETPDAVTFETLLERPDLSLQLARSICERHRIPAECTRIEEASQLVFSCSGERILKVFSPQDAEFHRAESVFLDQLHGRLPVPTPRLLATGSWGGYPYVLMEQLQGMPLDAVWNDLDGADRLRLFSRLAEAVRTLHALPVDSFAAAPFHWSCLIEEQRARTEENHRRWGLPEPWIAQIPGYLEAAGLALGSDAPLVPLHTELMPNHVLVRRSGGEWTITGLVDFEPSMVGRAEYDFCAVGIFLTQGDRDLLRHFLLAYGSREAELGEAMSRRIMGFLLLHRYGNLNRFMKRAPGHEGWTELRQAEQFWFGL